MKAFRRPAVAASAGVLVFFGLLAILSYSGLVEIPWRREIAARFSPPAAGDWRLWLGADLFGRSVLLKILQGARIAMVVGFLSSLLSVPIGMACGMLAGYSGGRLDEVITGLTTVLASVPNILLLTAAAFVLGRGMAAVFLALGFTGWIGLSRLIRAETMKLREADFVAAARSLGARRRAVLRRHILPNVAHFGIAAFPQHFLAAVKAEVILSFLGVGVVGEPSWGILMSDARMELPAGIWWPLAGTSGAMFLVLVSLNNLADALRDALDPKMK